MKRSCATCEWWDVVTEEHPDSPIQSSGMCRVNPPALVTDERIQGYGQWPQVYAENWCGEWRKKGEDNR